MLTTLRTLEDKTISDTLGKALRSFIRDQIELGGMKYTDKVIVDIHPCYVTLQRGEHSVRFLTLNSNQTLANLTTIKGKKYA